MKLTLVILWIGCSYASARTQTPIHVFDGDVASGQFGRSVSGAGDVNGDGFADLIVGSLKDTANGPWSGSARVFSGVDGSILYDFDGDSAHDLFGFSVSGAGDVNADGHDDFIVGAFQDDDNGPESGSARVFSGLDGSVLHDFDGNSAGDEFGYSVSDAGDVNADGFADLVVGAYEDNGNGPRSGSVTVFSGADGSILYGFDGDSPAFLLGFSVSGAGDVNGDGFDDVVAGALGDYLNGWAAGSVRVFSGLDGSVLYHFHGDYQHHELGWSVSGAGDVNADGFEDVISGARYSNHARVFSGADGSVLYDFFGDGGVGNGDFFGSSVSGAGDVNGDGHADLVIGAPRADLNGHYAGRVRVFSGIDGRILYTVDGDSAGDGLGISVSGAGNVDGIGFADLIFGASGDDNNGPGTGSARVVSGRDLIGASYCGPALPNSTGLAGILRAAGSPIVIHEVTLVASQLPPGQFGYFLAGRTQGFVNPIGSQGILCLSGNIGRYNRPADIIQGPTGALQLDMLSVPVNPPVAVQPGDTWNFQCWYRDSNPGPTSNFTDALSLTFGVLPEPTVEFPWSYQYQWEYTTALIVPITLSEPTDLPVSVYYSEGGTATPHVDYRVESPNPLVIPAGAIGGELQVTVANDSNVEPDETVILTLVSATNGVLGTQIVHTITILDDD